MPAHKLEPSLDVQVQDSLAMEESQAKGSVQRHQLSPVAEQRTCVSCRPETSQPQLAWQLA